MMLKNAVNSRKVGHDLRRKVLTDHNRHKIPPQVAVNSSQENSSLKRGSSSSTTLNPDKRRWPEVLHHVQLNSSQEKALFNRASVRDDVETWKTKFGNAIQYHTDMQRTIF